MAGGIVRITDPNAGGGVSMNGVSTVRVNGIPVVVTGASVTPHPNNKPPHTSARTIARNPTVRAGGLPIVTATDVDSCGHSRVSASPNVRIG
jgi:uncharacterized Zn-binding protein involved in type VI secretion